MFARPMNPMLAMQIKGGKGWLGFKAQVAETVTEEEGGVNFITYAEINDATDYDGDAVNDYVGEQKQNNVMPAEVYGDTHYNLPIIFKN